MKLSINLKAVFCGILVFAGIAFNSKVTDSPPVYLTNILIFTVNLIFIYAAIKSFKKYVLWDFLPTFLICLLLTIVTILYVNNPNALVVYPKLFLILITYYAFSRVFLLQGDYYIQLILFSFCLAMGLSPIFQVEFDSISALSTSNRIKVDNLGNFNAYAFLIALSLTSSLYLFPVIKSKLQKLLLIITQFPLIVVLLLSLSRGGLFALIFGLVIYNFSTSRKVKVYFVLASIVGMLVIFLYFRQLDSYDVLMNRFLNTNDDENFDSGRSIIYLILLNEIFATPFTFLFGNGIGAINVDVLAEENIVSAHNTYLDVFHSFGLVGLFFFLRYLRSTYLVLRKMPKSNKKSLFIAIFGQIIFCFFYDSYWGATQVGWVFPFMFALFWSSNLKYPPTRQVLVS